MRSTIKVINDMQAIGVIGRYAIGGAVGATYYLEPVATLDIDVFISFGGSSDGPIISLSPIYNYLRSRGYEAEGEYMVIDGWPVQFLPSGDALGEEALAQAIEVDLDGEPARVMKAEHLVALALQVGRSKDCARILQFMEAGVLNQAVLDGILNRHHLADKWARFKARFLEEL